MAKKSKPTDPDDEVSNPVIGWRGREECIARIEDTPTGRALVLFVGPGKAANEAARAFAAELGNPVHEILPEKRGKGDADAIERLVKKGPLKPMHPLPTGKDRPLLLMLGLDQFTGPAQRALKYLGDTAYEASHDFLCVATVQHEADIDEGLASCFVVVEAIRLKEPSPEEAAQLAEEKAAKRESKRAKRKPTRYIEIQATIGDAVAFVSNGQDIRIELNAGTYQFAELFKKVITEAAAKHGKLNKYQPLLKDIEKLLLGSDFRVKAHVWLGKQDLSVNLPADSGEIVPTGWAAPRDEDL